MEENQQLQKENNETNQLAISPNYLAAYLPAIGKITATNKSIATVFRSSEPQLSIIKKDAGETALRACIVLIIEDVIKFFNLGKTMNATQVAQTTDLIIEAFPLFKLDDISLCFRRAKMGNYGAMYDRIDGQIIMNWLYLYDSEKTAEIISIRENEKSNYNKAEPFVEYMPEDIKEEFDKIIPQFKPSLKDRGFEQSEFDRQLNEIYREFDDLHRKQQKLLLLDEKDGAIRYVQYNSKKLTAAQYIEQRISESI
jgi:hypothetical protein